MVGAIDLGGQPKVRTCLPNDLLAQNLESSRHIGAGDISGNLPSGRLFPGHEEM